MMPNGFTFRQFAIRHDRCAMKVGTDGVLLGAWARGGRRMLDLGAGTGLVSLMLAQRFPESRVEAVEIDAAAAAQCRENMAVSPFAGRVCVFAAAFQDFLPAAPYDAIVSNPPFFAGGVGSGDAARDTARHAAPGFFAEFFAFARRWLRLPGEVSLVVPAERAEAIAAEAYLAGFMLCRRVWVGSVAHKPAERCLLSFARQRLSEPELSQVWLMEPDGRRSEWYDRLTADFYLH